MPVSLFKVIIYEYCTWPLLCTIVSGTLNNELRNLWSAMTLNYCACRLTQVWAHRGKTSPSNGYLR